MIDSFGNVFPCEMLDKKLGNLRDYDYDLKKILILDSTKEVLKYIKDRKYITVPGNVLYRTA